MQDTIDTVVGYAPARQESQDKPYLQYARRSIANAISRIGKEPKRDQGVPEVKNDYSRS
jgi:hypothetical protein